MTPFELGLLAVAVPIVALGAAELTLRRTVIGAGLAVVVFAVQLVFPLPSISLGMRLAPNDIVYGLLLVAALLRIMRSGVLSWQQRILLLIFAVGMVAVVRGAPEFGVSGATNEARKFIYWTGGALYVSTLAPRRALLDRIGLLWLLLAGLLTIVGLLRMVGLLPGAEQEFASQGRPLDSNETLIIAQGGFIALATLRHGMNRFPGWLAPIFLAMVVLMRHRTVWIVALVALVVFVATHMDVARRLLGLLVAGVLVTIVLLVTVFDAGETRATEQLAQSATYVDTFEWRVEGWASLLTARRATEVDLVLGAPFGSGWRRVVDGRLVDVSPHNWYLELFLRVGAVGLAAFLILMGRAVLALRIDDGRGGMLSNHVLLILLTTQLVYFLAYDPRTVQSLVSGLCLCAVGSVRQEGHRLPDSTHVPSIAVAPR